MLTPMLRDIEEKGNLLFSEYAKLYYGEEGCISNFYVFESEEGLNFAFYIRKGTPHPMQSTRTPSASGSGARPTPSKSGATLRKAPTTSSRPASSTSSTSWTRRPMNWSRSTGRPRET